MKNIIIIFIIVFAGLLIWFSFSIKSNKNNSNQSYSDVTLEELIDDIRQNKNSNNDIVSDLDFTIGEVATTNGIKHSVPLDQIVGGGPAKDGIPSIDNPKFISINDAEEFLDDDDPGIAVSIDGIDRFYPFEIMVWHEIVNDDYNGKKVLVTYCPLCLLGIVFDPEVNGERVEFGTSGKLWQSNLVMYDRKTDSYWSQVLGESIVGEMTGTKLKTFSSDRIRFKEWKNKYPNGQVLSRDTGTRRSYGTDPYGNYYSNNSLFFSEVNNKDDRLLAKEYVLGIVVDDQAKAYIPDDIIKAGGIRDNFAGNVIIGEYKKDLDVVRLYKELSDGTRERIDPVPGFWFSWVAAHPETKLYK